MVAVDMHSLEFHLLMVHKKKLRYLVDDDGMQISTQICLFMFCILIGAILHNALYKIGNDFSTTLRYYPMKDSKFNTSLKYEINYDSEIKPSTDSGYKFLLGTPF